MTKKVDFIIVGQGLAGSILTYVLLKNGKTVHVFDDNKKHSSSRVAAGLYNPITGRKMVKTWNAERLFPLIEPFYRDIELTLRRRFLHPVKIYRPFLSIAEQNEWQAKSADPSFAPYIETIYLNSRFNGVNDPFGGISLKPSGYLDIPSLLGSMASYLNELKCLSSEFFDQKKLKVDSRYLEYRGITASKIVICTGIYTDALFSFLPLRPVKGEILDIMSELKVDTIISRGVFVLPKGNGNYRVGATYNWKNLSVNMTEEGEKYLIDKFETLVNTDYKILGGKAGIRPTTPDRRPFIGMHPKRPKVGIFNGFGTKGVSLVPYYANQFYRVLEFGEVLDSEVNINRYFSLS